MYFQEEFLEESIKEFSEIPEFLEKCSLEFLKEFLEGFLKIFFLKVIPGVISRGITR